jgi:hypothetical protein
MAEGRKGMEHINLTGDYVWTNSSSIATWFVATWFATIRLTRQSTSRGSPNCGMSA